MSVCRMYNNSSFFIDNCQIIIFINYFNINVFRFNFNSFQFWNYNFYCIIFFNFISRLCLFFIYQNIFIFYKLLNTCSCQLELFRQKFINPATSLFIQNNNIFIIFTIFHIYFIFKFIFSFIFFIHNYLFFFLL